MDRPRAIDMDKGAWERFFDEMGEKRYRAGQVCAWLWKRGISDPSAMTDFSKTLRERLASAVDFSLPRIEREEHAQDGTRKFLLEMNDGALVECVLMKHTDRSTACVSSQVGCPVGCPFCYTGQSGFERDLTQGEIAAQLLVMEQRIGRPIENLVLMGMGEPLLNYDAVMSAIKMINDPAMRGLGIRHITLSTSGIVPAVRRMADDGAGARLAVSLHAPSDELRDELVPCNSSYPIRELLDAMKYYSEKSGSRITIGYSLFKGVNDSIHDARKLVAILRGQHVYINLIPGNEHGRFKSSPPEDVLRFQSVLKSAGYESEIRVSKGRDISAACGQLRRRERERL